MKVRKAIIPAAGLGTRVLPASKAIPKEMLNIVDKPAIQYIVEEAFNSGIEEVLIITNRGKGAIEDHFDHAYELESKLKDNEGKKDIYNDVLACSKFGNIFFIRQKETKGLGHAVLCAKSFVGNEPFAVLYGDDVIISDNPVTKQLCDAYEKYGKGCVGVKEVPKKDVPKYCSLAVEKIEGNCFNYPVRQSRRTNPQPFTIFDIVLDRMRLGKPGQGPVFSRLSLSLFQLKPRIWSKYFGWTTKSNY